MSKSRKHNKWYDEEDDYDRETIIKRDRDRRRAKKIKSALKTKDIDYLREVEND